MGEVSKVVGQWIVANTGWSVVIFLFILSGLFKIVKIEINPLAWVIGWVGKALTKDVRNDISELKIATDKKFEDIQKDRTQKISELKDDYNKKITDLKEDLDEFEQKTKEKMIEIHKEGQFNCESVTARLDEMQRSNDMQTVRQIKAHVLEFANSCLNKVKHTKKDFDNIIAENQEYETLVRKYHLVNDVYTEDYSYIMKVYHKCLEENSFLKESDAE